MLNNFNDLIALAKNKKSKVVVVCAHDLHALEAVIKASEEGLLDYILIGKKEEIIKIAKDNELVIEEEKIINSSEEKESAYLATKLINEGKADFISKGLMQTSTLLKAVVDKEEGISLGKLMSHMALLELPNYHKVIGVSDGGMIPHPDLAQKIEIVNNATEMYKKLNYSEIKIAGLCASENVSEKIAESVDAKALSDMSKNGELQCYFEGPISFDLAMNKKASIYKGYESKLSGDVDCLLMPSMASGNIMVKALIQFAGAKMAGVILGSKCPIALNSRFASYEEKYYSLLLCACLR